MLQESTSVLQESAPDLWMYFVNTSGLLLLLCNGALRRPRHGLRVACSCYPTPSAVSFRMPLSTRHGAACSLTTDELTRRAHQQAGVRALFVILVDPARELRQLQSEYPGWAAHGRGRV